MNHPKHYRHGQFFMNPERWPLARWPLDVKTCRRKWRMTYGWRNNPVAASMHFASAALFTDCAQRAAKITDRFPIFEVKKTEASVKAMFETAAGHAALVDRWVRVGKAHRWEVK